MKYFFSVDWGTSSLRVRLAGILDHSIMVHHEVTNHYGCSYVFDLFKSEKNGIAREDYFLNFLRPYLTLPDNISPKASIPVVISGMATSSIGIREITYSPLPFALDGSDLRYEIILRSEKFDYDVLLLSGLSSTDDVMRGEEVQLLGLLQEQSFYNEAVFILPGTHSKHIHVRENRILSFKTYITGEMFQLLSTYSLLKNSIVKRSAVDQEAFCVGVKLSTGNILHSVFGIRASTLIQDTNPSSNYSVLSGLLIGSELKELTHSELPIFLCAHGNLADSYALAIHELSMQNRCTIVPSKQVDEAVIHGQRKIAERIWNGIT